MDWLKTLASIRLNFHRTTQVLYTAPGFLHGTYMLEKRGRVTQADLIDHAIKMRYGDDTSMVGGTGIHIVVKQVL